MGKKVTITLTVEASTLYAIPNPTQAQVDSHCSLSDDNGEKTSYASLREFTTQVYLDNDVKWIGAVADLDEVDQGYSVAIDSIIFKFKEADYRNYFNSIAICGTGGRSGNVTAKVKNDSDLLDYEDLYSINFRVYESGNKHKNYMIDPKLKANT